LGFAHPFDHHEVGDRVGHALLKFRFGNNVEFPASDLGREAHVLSALADGQ
jgi:hypothetical protein